MEPLPRDADFIYIDGPNSRVDGVVLPNTDIQLMLDNGARPNVIVVDGRTPTVNLILGAIDRSDYVIELSTRYAASKSSLINVMVGGYHSVFVRKQSANAPVSPKHEG